MNNPLSEFESQNNISFQDIFDSYYKSLCFFSYQILGDKDLAEDVTQDAFLNYWKQRESLSQNEKVIKSYLYSSVKFISLNHIRHKKVVHSYIEKYNPSDLLEDEINKKIIHSEVLNELHLALDTLPEGCREVFRLGYFEGFNNSKIAEVLDISINTVKTHKQRGLKALRSLQKPEAFLILTLLF